MDQFFGGMKNAGVDIKGEAIAREYLTTVGDVPSGITALARQGRSMGVEFTTDLQRFSGPALDAVLTQAGLTEDQVIEFLANTKLQFR